jgi:hypothetical protein
MLTQLSPYIPVVFQSKPGIWNKGVAIAILDYSQEHDLLWVIAEDKTGEVWTLNNKLIKLQQNITMGRVL